MQGLLVGLPAGLLADLVVEYEQVKAQRHVTSVC